MAEDEEDEEEKDGLVAIWAEEENYRDGSSLYPMYFGISSSFLSLHLLSAAADQNIDRNRRRRLAEMLLHGSASLLGLLFWRAQKAAEKMAESLRRAESEVARLKSLRMEDAKANEKVMGILAEREQRWISDKRKLKLQIKALMNQFRVLEVDKSLRMAAMEEKIRKMEVEREIDMAGMKERGKMEEEREMEMAGMEERGKMEEREKMMRRIEEEREKMLREIWEEREKMIRELGEMEKKMAAMEEEREKMMREMEEEREKMMRRIEEEREKMLREIGEEREKMIRELGEMEKKMAAMEEEREKMMREMEEEREKKMTEVEEREREMEEEREKMMREIEEGEKMMKGIKEREKKLAEMEEREMKMVEERKKMMAEIEEEREMKMEEERKKMMREMDEREMKMEEERKKIMGEIEEKEMKMEWKRKKMMAEIEDEGETKMAEMKKNSKQKESLKMKRRVSMERRSGFHHRTLLIDYLQAESKMDEYDKEQDFSRHHAKIEAFKDLLHKKDKKLEAYQRRLIKKELELKSLNIGFSHFREESFKLEAQLNAMKNQLSSLRLQANGPDHKNSYFSTSMTTQLIKDGDFDRIDRSHSIRVDCKIKRLKQQLLTLERVDSSMGFLPALTLLMKQLKSYQILQEKVNDLCKRMANADLPLPRSKCEDVEKKAMEGFLEEAFLFQRNVVAAGQKMAEVQPWVSTNLATATGGRRSAATEFSLARFAAVVRILFREVQAGMEGRIARIIEKLEETLACHNILHERG